MNRWLLAIGSMLAGAGLVLGIQHGTVRWRESHPTEAGGVVLASVDGQAITVADFEREIKRRGGESNFPTEQHRRAAFDDLVRQAVLVANARRAGYDRDPDTRREMGYVLSGRYRQAHIEPALAETRVSEEELRAYYESNPALYTVPESAHAAIIHFALERNDSPQRRQAMAELAEQTRAAAQQQDPKNHFGALAAENSNDQASRYQGGDIGWVERDQQDSRWEPAVLEAIFALQEPGDLSAVVEGERGLYVIRLLQHQPASLRPLNEVAASIHAELLARKRQARSEELYAHAAAGVDLNVHEERLAAAVVPQRAVVERQPGPPPVPNR